MTAHYTKDSVEDTRMELTGRWLPSGPTRSLLVLGCLLLTGWLPISCSAGDEVGSNRGSVRSGSRALYSLLAHGEALRVHTTPDKFPIRNDHMKAGPDRAAGGGPLRCLEMRTPTQLSYALVDPPPDARLEYAVAIRNNGYRGEGKVSWNVLLNGQSIDRVVLDCSGSVPTEEQRWHHREVPLPTGGDLRFEVQLEGDHTRNMPVPVGLGLLRVAVPYEVERQRSGPDAPNIIMVVIDTLRSDGLGCLGNPRDTSPFMDRLAAEGTLFEQAYSSAPWTLPGTASIVTGLSNAAHGVGEAGSSALAEGLDTIATILARAGFTTAAFTANPLIDEAHNYHLGFETFEMGGWIPARNMEAGIHEFLQTVGEQRFFLYLHPSDPHAPLRKWPRSRDHLNITKPQDVYGVKLREVLDQWYAGSDVDLEKIRRTNDYNLELYGGEVYEVDRLLAGIHDTLAELGQADNTLICITADHGEEFLEHDLVGHFNQLYPESVRVPLIFWGPGVPQGVRVSEATENRHSASTLLRTARVPLTGSLDGPNLLVAEDRDAIRPAGVFITSQKGRRGHFEARQATDLGVMRSWIEEPWQLIHVSQVKQPGRGAGDARSHQGYSLLYNLQEDPGCHHDLAAQHPERVARMKQAITDWLEEGESIRPALLPTSRATGNQLRAIGYMGANPESTIPENSRSGAAEDVDGDQNDEANHNGEQAPIQAPVPDRGDDASAHSGTESLGGAVVGSVESPDVGSEAFSEAIPVAVTSSAVTASEITPGEITPGEITSGEITSGEITSGEITSGEITSGEITSGEITSGAVSSGEVTAGAVTLSEITASGITASGITASAVTAGAVTASAVTSSAVTSSEGRAGRGREPVMGVLDPLEGTPCMSIAQRMGGIRLHSDSSSSSVDWVLAPLRSSP